MTTKTLDSPTGTIDLSKLGKASEDLVRFAIYAGWIGKNTPAGGVILTSTYVPGQSINVPAQSNLQENRKKGWTRKVMRYADPVRRAVVEAHFDDIANKKRAMSMPSTEAELIGAEGMTIPASILPPEPEPLAPAKDEPTVISERPWLAKLNTSDKQGRTYESHAVVERKWSDGTTDYRCSMTWCDYSNELPVPVARHYGRSKNHPAREVEPVVMATEPYVQGHRDNSARIERLAREIAAALEGIDFGTEDRGSLAEAIAAKMIERRDARGDREDHEGEPLTADQILERIRGLVDDGSYLRRLERERELEDRLALLETTEAQAQDRALRAELDCQRIREEWDTLRELIAQRGPGNE